MIRLHAKAHLVFHWCLFNKPFVFFVGKRSIQLFHLRTYYIPGYLKKIANCYPKQRDHLLSKQIIRVALETFFFLMEKGDSDQEQLLRKQTGPPLQLSTHNDRERAI